MFARALGLAFLALAAPPAPAAELKHLHVLLVVDTTDSNLKDSVGVDLKRMTDLFKGTVPPDRYTVTPVVGDLTPKKVRDAVAGLKAGPDDGVVFYYAGHGGQDADTRRPFFAAGWKPGSPTIPTLFRDEVRAALAAKKPALTVLLTDCCSDPIDLKGVKKKSRGLGADANDPPAPVLRGLGGMNMRRLFFESRGVVDVTAATDDKSWGTVIRGGFFTYSFNKLVTGEAELQSWSDLVARVAKETPTLHEQQINRGLIERAARFQTPRAYAVGQPPPPNPPARRVFAVVSIRNPTAADVQFQFRWADGRAAWQAMTLRAGEGPALTYVEVPGGQTLPQFEVDMPDTKGLRFDAKRWEGTGLPTLKDAVGYRITPQK